MTAEQEAAFVAVVAGVLVVAKQVTRWMHVDTPGEDTG